MDLHCLLVQQEITMTLGASTVRRWKFSRNLGSRTSVISLHSAIQVFSRNPVPLCRLPLASCSASA